MDTEMEIDPEMFMICRLCVDSKGKFQIVPSVQKNIKEFFDIDIQPFDGLSQLICNACKIILSEFCTVKNTYQQKQKSLLARANKVLENEPSNNSDGDNTEALVTQASPVSSPSPKPNEVKPADRDQHHEDVEKKLVASDKKRDEQSHGSSNESTEYDRRYSASTTGRNSDTDMAEPVPSTLKKGLRSCRLSETHTKFINCRLCIKECKNIYILKKHMKSHRGLVFKHKNILRYHCYVPLHHLEGPLENSKHTVVLEPSLILEDGANPDYFITYKNRFLEPDMLEVSRHRRKRSSYAQYFNESDDETRSNLSNKRFKRLQVISDSEESTSTLLNDSLNETPNLVMPDIDTDVDDLQEGTGLHDPCNILTKRVSEVAADGATYTSDNSSNDNTTAIKDKEQKFKSEVNDLNLIQEVIQAAFRRYDSSSELDKLDNIKNNDIRKFLSIGRRVLTSNFRATGLIKYLEKNDISINWIDQNKGSTVAQNKSKSEAHFIRIGSKIEEFPSGDNLYGFTRHDPPTEADAPTDAEKVLLLNYDEVQKRISEFNNNVTKTGNNNTNVSEDHDSVKLPTAQHLRTILNRSQMLFPRSSSPANSLGSFCQSQSISGIKQPVNIVSPLNNPSAALNQSSIVNKSSTSNRPFGLNNPPAAKVPHALDSSDDEDNGIDQPTFVMVNPASVKIKPITKKNNYVQLPLTLTSNPNSTIATTTTIGSSQTGGTVILNQNPVSNPKPGGMITYKNKKRKNVSKSVGNVATLVPIGTPLFEQPPIRTSSANQGSSLSPHRDNPIQTVSPTAVSAPKSSLPTHHHPAFTVDTVICLDDEESLDNMPVITSTTSLATIKYEENVKPPLNTIEPDQAERGNESKLESQIILQNSLILNKTYIKCKPVHELMRTSDQIPSTVASKVVTENGNGNIAQSTNFLSIDGTVDRLSIPAPNTKHDDSVNESAKLAKVMLNTVMLPNLMTSSPVTYLKTLMNLQGLTLLEKPDNILVCLIKFKLGVHQPPISTMLCLYLMARPKVFCLKVTNGNNIADVKEMSAAWQMEILKAFKDKSVTQKIMDGAATKGTDLLESVKLFFSILNSIEMKIPNPS